MLSEKSACALFVRNRKSGVCFASKQNDEEREARNFCGDKNLLVEDIPAESTDSKKVSQLWCFLYGAREQVNCFTCVQESKSLSIPQRAEGEVRCETCTVPVVKDTRIRVPAEITTKGLF